MGLPFVPHFRLIQLRVTATLYCYSKRRRRVECAVFGSHCDCPLGWQSWGRQPRQVTRPPRCQTLVSCWRSSRRWTRATASLFQQQSHHWIQAQPVLLNLKQASQSYSHGKFPWINKPRSKTCPSGCPAEAPSFNLTAEIATASLHCLQEDHHFLVCDCWRIAGATAVTARAKTS